MPLACTRFWAPVLGFFSTVDPWKTPDGEMRPHSTCTPTTLWTFVEPPGSQSSELLTRPMCLRRLVASDPLWTTNHPLLFSLGRRPLLPSAAHRAGLCALLPSLSLQAPSWRCQAACIPGGW